VVTNYGRIEAIGVDTSPEASDGVGGQGGGEVINAATGTITGVRRGIWAHGGFTVDNAGFIHGDQQGVFLLGHSTNSVVNSGTVESFYAAIQAQGGNNTVTNSGRIAGARYAVLFLGGNNVLELREGSELVGVVEGGPDNDLLRLTQGVEFERATNFEQLEVTGDALVRGDSVFDVTSIAKGATLTLGEGGTTGSVGSSIRNEGVLRLDRSDELVLSAPVSGTGSLVQAGIGSTTLAGTNSFTGTVEVSGGTLRLSAGEALQDATVVRVGSGGTLELLDDEAIGTLAGNGAVVLADSMLTLTQATDGFDGAISGTGGIELGNSAFRLGGANSFSGDAVVNAGQLTVDGTLQSTVVLGQMGVLGGSGSVATIRSTGGIIAPGNSIGQLNVAGDVTFSADDIYLVEVDATGASDLLAVGGRAVLNGASVQVEAEAAGYRGRTSYTILTADGGVNGTFGAVASNLAFLDPTLVYNANDVRLVLTRNDVDFVAAGTTANERAVGAAVQSLGPDNELFEEALFLSDTNAPSAFGDLSGEIYVGVATGLVENARAIQRQLAGRSSGDAGGLYGWGSALGSWGHADASGRSARLETEQLGLLGGLGYRANGFDVALGGGVSEADFEALGEAEVSSTILAATAGYNRGAFFARAGASYAWHDGSTKRSAGIGELGGEVSGDLDGDTQQLFARIGYSAMFGDFEVAPFAGIDYIRAQTGAIVEEGGTTALTLAEDTRSVTYTELGVALSLPPSDQSGGMSVRPFASATWRHAGGDTGQVLRAELDGASFLVSGPALADDAAELAAGLELTSGALSINAGYEGCCPGDGQATRPRSLRGSPSRLRRIGSGVRGPGPVSPLTSRWDVPPRLTASARRRGRGRSSAARTRRRTPRR
jgi:autotransporter-associated beta strand protein